MVLHEPRKYRQAQAAATLSGRPADRADSYKNRVLYFITLYAIRFTVNNSLVPYVPTRTLQTIPILYAEPNENKKEQSDTTKIKMEVEKKRRK